LLFNSVLCLKHGLNLPVVIKAEVRYLELLPLSIRISHLIAEELPIADEGGDFFFILWGVLISEVFTQGTGTIKDIGAYTCRVLTIIEEGRTVPLHSNVEYPMLRGLYLIVGYPLQGVSDVDHKGILYWLNRLVLSIDQHL
jgi:hypothetical protein